MTNPYRGHRFPAEAISYWVWLYYTFPLSFRDIEKRFLSAFEPIRGHFHPYQHKQTAPEYREIMRQRIESWRSLTCLSPPA